MLGNILPGDEDELLAGIMDDFDLSGLPSQLEDLEDDFFSSGGGLEMEQDPQENLLNGFARLSIPDGVPGTGIGHSFSNGSVTVAGEHPYGEHPSRTLFVRNINSNVEDSELRFLFEVHLLLPVAITYIVTLANFLFKVRDNPFFHTLEYVKTVASFKFFFFSLLIHLCCMYNVSGWTILTCEELAFWPFIQVYGVISINFLRIFRYWTFKLHGKFEFYI